MFNVVYTTGTDDKPKLILLNGKVIGSIKRVVKNALFESHWYGEIVNEQGETWRISETNLKAVTDRIKEAYGKFN